MYSYRAATQFQRQHHIKKYLKLTRQYDNQFKSFKKLKMKKPLIIIDKNDEQHLNKQYSPKKQKQTKPVRSITDNNQQRKSLQIERENNSPTKKSIFDEINNIKLRQRALSYQIPRQYIKNNTSTQINPQNNKSSLNRLKQIVNNKQQFKILKNNIDRQRYCQYRWGNNSPVLSNLIKQQKKNHFLMYDSLENISKQLSSSKERLYPVDMDLEKIHQERVKDYTTNQKPIQTDQHKKIYYKNNKKYDNKQIQNRWTPTIHSRLQYNGKTLDNKKSPQHYFYKRIKQTIQQGLKNKKQQSHRIKNKIVQNNLRISKLSLYEDNTNPNKNYSQIIISRREKKSKQQNGDSKQYSKKKVPKYNQQDLNEFLYDTIDSQQQIKQQEDKNSFLAKDMKRYKLRYNKYQKTKSHLQKSQHKISIINETNFKKQQLPSNHIVKNQNNCRKINQKYQFQQYEENDMDKYQQRYYTLQAYLQR